MRITGHTIRFLVPLAATALALGTAGAAAAKTDAKRYVVVLRGGADVTAVVRAHDRLPGATVLLTYRHALRGYGAELSKTALAAVRRDPRVDYVVADRPLSLAGQTTPTGVQRIGARNVSRQPTTVRSIVGDVGVAVIDTGVDLDHPDLGMVVPGASCVAKTALPDDDHGHGTHVAGTVAALDNDLGVVGVAPGATIYAVKIFDSAGRGSWTTALCGLDWAVAHAGLVRVANLSFVGRGYVTPSGPGCVNGNQDVLHTAVCALATAGVTVVAAAGNDGRDTTSYVPAAYDEVIAVSALADFDGVAGGLGAPTCNPYERDDAFATFSNFGQAIDIAAPGVCIESTWKNGGYGLMSGTSMAAPHVAGAVALLLHANPVLSPAEARARLLANQEPGPVPGDPDSFAEGVVRAAAGTDPTTNASAPDVGTVAVPAAPPVPALPPVPHPVDLPPPPVAPLPVLPPAVLPPLLGG